MRLFPEVFEYLVAARRCIGAGWAVVEGDWAARMAVLLSVEHCHTTRRQGSKIVVGAADRIIQKQRFVQHFPSH